MKQLTIFDPFCVTRDKMEAMANFGKCLLFYLKYPAEMDRLYETDEPDVDDLPDAESLMERISIVGDTASREAAAKLTAPIGDTSLRSALEALGQNVLSRRKH